MILKDFVHCTLVIILSNVMGLCMIKQCDNVRFQILAKTCESRQAGRCSKLLHLTAQLQGLDIGHEVGNQGEIEVWIIDILNLSPINEPLDKRIELAQVILEVFDVCLFFLLP